MMMFPMHSAFALLLLALTGGVFLWAWSKKHASRMGKFFGMLVVVLSVLHLVCASYTLAKNWKMGGFNMPSMRNMPMMNMDKKAP